MLDPSYLLDACLISKVQRSGHLPKLLAACKKVSLGVIAEVHDELTRGDSERAKQTKKLLDQGPVTVIELPLGSPAAEQLKKFRASKTTANADLGEHASIAYALHAQPVRFVTVDVGATFLMLSELGDRAVAYHWFLRELVEKNAISPRDAADLSNGMLREQSNVLEPSWWGAWLKAKQSGTSKRPK